MYFLPEATIHHIIPAEKLTDAYFFRLCRLIGRSERIRTLNLSVGTYIRRLLMECIKWAGACVVATGYMLCFQWPRAEYVLRMRWLITKGLLGY